ncbi:MauE/DoxX family redox-associated membrane protein [Nonomuraea sp. KM90]|uniref:MauE/DoxX family redox-associated membrane protein n=1 Tax=Nonomuraea sp. KM90 TaxID=3457428 RepID=UPI003FCE58A1
MLAYLLLSCRVAVSGVFLLSFAGKIRGRTAYREFVASVEALNVVPRPLARAAATAVIAAEACTALLVALPPPASFAGFVLAVGLLTAFTGVILVALRRGSTAPCRCFGAAAAPLGRPHVIRKLTLLAVSVTGLAGAAGVATVRLAGEGVLAAVIAAAVVVLLVSRFDDLLALFRPEGAR